MGKGKQLTGLRPDLGYPYDVKVGPVRTTIWFGDVMILAVPNWVFNGEYDSLRRMNSLRRLVRLANKQIKGEKNGKKK